MSNAHIAKRTACRATHSSDVSDNVCVLLLRAPASRTIFSARFVDRLAAGRCIT
jgi:hypothetical protein